MTSVGRGIGAASAVGVGSWSLVSLFGIASTGTPIVSLYGAAAVRATLACFGGGALAAGGAGMAGGVTMLGWIVAIPFVAVSTWSAHSKASEVDLKTQEIIKLTTDLHARIKELVDAIETTRNRRQELCNAHYILNQQYITVYSTLFPRESYSKLWRFTRSVFGQNYYHQSEMPLICSLQENIKEFASHFHGVTVNPNDTNDRGIAIIRIRRVFLIVLITLIGIIIIASMRHLV